MKYLFVLSLILFVSCERLMEKYYVVYFKNNTSNKVWIYLDHYKADFQYPDTQLQIEKKWYIEVIENSGYSLYSKDPYDKYLKMMPKDTMSLYIIDAKVYEDSSWTTIRENYLILKRYDLSIEDLKVNNFIITYP